MTGVIGFGNTTSVTSVSGTTGQGTSNRWTLHGTVTKQFGNNTNTTRNNDAPIDTNIQQSLYLKTSGGMGIIATKVIRTIIIIMVITIEVKLEINERTTRLLVNQTTLLHMQIQVQIKIIIVIIITHKMVTELIMNNCWIRTIFLQCYVQDVFGNIFVLLSIWMDS